MSFFLGVPVGAAYHLVFAFTQLLTPVAGGLAAAAAIVLFTAAVRLLISPLSLRALRGQAAMARLAPQVKALNARHGRQPERFKRELAALYKREGASPLSGVLPLLVQWPFLSVTYLLFSSATVHGVRNRLLTDGLFGVPLGAHPLSALSGAGLLSPHGAVFITVFAVLTVLCWLSARLAKRVVPANAAGTADAHVASGQRHSGAGSSAAAHHPGAAPADGKAAGLLTRVLPYVTVVFAAFVPLAADIYLLTTVAWTLAERRLFLRRTRSARAAAPGAAAAASPHR